MESFLLDLGGSIVLIVLGYMGICALTARDAIRLRAQVAALEIEVTVIRAQLAVHSGKAQRTVDDALDHLLASLASMREQHKE